MLSPSSPGAGVKLKKEGKKNPQSFLLFLDTEAWEEVSTGFRRRCDFCVVLGGKGRSGGAS